MKFFTVTASLLLATLSISSPVPDPSGKKELGPVLNDIRAATPKELMSTFGYATFEEFLASQVSERANIPSTIFKRSTKSVCQQKGVLWDDAYAVISRLASLPSGTQCGNSNLPPGCTVMQVYKTARVGFCGPTTTKISCNTASKYLQGIMNTCKYPIYRQGGVETGTGGYQGLNENTLNYVYLDRAP
jgi:hypothetical protein